MSPACAADAVEIERLSAGAQVQREASDDQSSEKLTKRQCREKRDVHRECHRHLSFRNVLEGFLENRIAADRGSRDAGYIDVRNCSNNYTPADALPVNWRRWVTRTWRTILRGSRGRWKPGSQWRRLPSPSLSSVVS